MARKKREETYSTRFMVGVALVSLFSLIAIGSVVFHYLEDWTWMQSIYFTVVTLTTVGYGDLTPTTDESRLVATVFILLGVTIAVSAVGIIGSGYLQRRASHRSQD